MKNPQTSFAPRFLTHIIARIDGVYCLLDGKNLISSLDYLRNFVPLLFHFEYIQQQFYILFFCNYNMCNFSIHLLYNKLSKFLILGPKAKVYQQERFIMAQTRYLADFGKKDFA